MTDATGSIGNAVIPASNFTLAYSNKSTQVVKNLRGYLSNTSL